MRLYSARIKRLRESSSATWRDAATLNFSNCFERSIIEPTDNASWSKGNSLIVYLFFNRVNFNFFELYFCLFFFSYTALIESTNIHLHRASFSNERFPYQLFSTFHFHNSVYLHILFYNRRKKPTAGRYKI